MRKTRPWRRNVALVVAAAAINAVGAGDAHAWTNYYCNTGVYGGSWCGDGSNHTYDNNKSVVGNGGVLVCERMLWADSTYLVAQPFCHLGQAFKSYGANSSYLYEAEAQHTWTGVRMTVYGTAMA